MQQPNPSFFLLLASFLLLLHIAHASDDREENLLRSNYPRSNPTVSPLCPYPCNTKNPRAQKKVTLYMMSKDERAAEALLVLAPLARYHPNLHIDIDFIATLDTNGTFHSHNGVEEVEGDFWELCAIEHYRANSSYLEFLVCLSHEYSAIPSNAERCLTQAGFDRGLMSECVATEGPALLQQSIKRTTSLGLDSQEGTVIFINGEKYTGPVTPAAFGEALCTMNGVVGDDDEFYHKWWFYFLLALGVVVGVTVLITGMITAYHLYVKCNRASDMWLNMIKTSPGSALNFETKVQNAMYRFEKDGYHDGGYGGPAAGVRPSERGMEEGRASYSYAAYSAAAGAGAPFSINYASSSSSSSPDVLDDSPRAEAPYYEEDSPLLAPSAFSSGWTMGGLRE